MNYYLAIDLGATSGRHVVAHKEKNEIVLEEIYRFKTGMDDTKDGLVWNIPLFFEEIKKGIKIAFEKYRNIISLSIDTWGVDYVLMNGDKEIPPFYAYRNARNLSSCDLVDEIIPFRELYHRTGIQFATFNTIYQLYDDLQKGRLDNATDYLMLPSYFTYKLTGVKTHEYTDESTGALLNIETNDYDFEIIDKLGLPRKLFTEIKHPGYVIGDLLPEIQKEVGGNCKVVLCPSHDTASAFEAVDLPEKSILISSGTWSLLGVKNKDAIVTDKSRIANYTNEGGVGYYRFLKNIMGMWIANSLRDETGLPFHYIDNGLRFSKYKNTFDVNDPSLTAPKDMRMAIYYLLRNNPPKDTIDMFASIYQSMAICYRKSIEELENITGEKYLNIYIVGGGAKNKYLNKLVAKETGKNVKALPIEATSMGNIKTQMEAFKE